LTVEQSSKSHTLQQVALGLGIPFHSQSVSMQTTKTDLIGFVDANGVYRYNGFIHAFRDGGLFNLDEIDAGNPNVLVVLNSAISNGFIETPDGNMLTKHDNFRMACTANTVGTGANTKYVGRNKLDAATLDRFALVHFELDEELEEKLSGDKALASGFRAMRKLADKKFEDIMITMRSCIGTSKLMKAGIDVETALNIHCFKGIDEDAKGALLKEFKANYKSQVANEKVFTVEKPKSLHKCPACGGNMIEKEGKYGKFIGCDNYPKCPHTEKISKEVVEDTSDPFAF